MECTYTIYAVKVTGHSKILIFCRVTVQAFFALYHVPFNAQISSYLDLKFHNVPFCIFLIDFADQCPVEV